MTNDFILIRQKLKNILLSIAHLTKKTVVPNCFKTMFKLKINLKQMKSYELIV